MLSATRGLRAGGQAGTPVKDVFAPLSALGLKMRLGQMVLVAAAPNVGKSPFALNLAYRAQLRTLYISADTDAHTQYTRLCSMHTGIPIEDIARYPAGYERYISDLHHIQFVYESSLSQDDVDDELMAYAQVYGAWPEIIVVDNLANIDAGGDDRWGGLESVCDYLHDVARKTGALIVALHHVTGEHENGDSPVPLSGLRGKISKVPEQVLTLWRAGDDTWPKMGVAIVKNRGGNASAAGHYNTLLSWDLERGILA